MNRDQRLERNKRLKEILAPDKRLLDACNELRYAVEHPNADSEIMMAQGVYKHKDPTAIMTVTIDGVVIGYKVKACSLLEINPYFDRYAYVRVPDHRLTDLLDKQLASIKLAVLEAFFEPQQGEVKTEVIGNGAILMSQRFMVVFPVKFQDATIQVPQGFNG
jgi:hypothetical protein